MVQRAEREGGEDAGLLYGCGLECAVSKRAGGGVCELEQWLPFADGGGVGEGGAGRSERTAVSVGLHHFVGPGELLRLPQRLRLRCESDARLSSDLRHWRLPLHESGGVLRG